MRDFTAHAESHTELRHSAFQMGESEPELVFKFWGELRRLAPASEIHVVDPFILHCGGQAPADYAIRIEHLLRPVARQAQEMTFVYSKLARNVEVAERISQELASANDDLKVRFCRGADMHARYIVADRARTLRMDFSLNGFGKSFGTVSLVRDQEDLVGILGELDRLDPR